MTFLGNPFIFFGKRHVRHPGMVILLFQKPYGSAAAYPEHDLFIQLKKLKNTLRYLMGEDLITHLGLEYYEEIIKNKESY
jgi:hypothetical protein